MVKANTPIQLLMFCFHPPVLFIYSLLLEGDIYVYTSVSMTAIEVQQI